MISLSPNFGPHPPESIDIVVRGQTITADDIDQALLRPGRLVSHRVFKRLDIPQATALAASLGKTLAPAQDYSLAEVFADGQPEHVARPQIGFSACSVNLPAALEGKETSSTPDILGGT